MPMTPSGKLPIARAGEYLEILTCVGAPRCRRTGHYRKAAQDEKCGMCKRDYEYVEAEKK